VAFELLGVTLEVLGVLEVGLLVEEPLSLDFAEPAVPGALASAALLAVLAPEALLSVL